MANFLKDFGKTATQTASVFIRRTGITQSMAYGKAVNRLSSLIKKKLIRLRMENSISDHTSKISRIKKWNRIRVLKGQLILILNFKKLNKN